MDLIRRQLGCSRVGVFLPLAGVRRDAVHPPGRGAAHKAVALVAALATLAVGIFTLASSTTTRPASCSSSSTSRGST